MLYLNINGIVMKLEEYKTLEEKKDFFQCTTIETIEDFRNNEFLFDESGKCAFRGVKEAKYKLYTSAQRCWMANHLTADNECFHAYVDELICQVKKTKCIEYFAKYGISVNDFLLMALLQHYGKPSPLLDFSYNPFIALFFAFDGVSLSSDSNSINNYVSVYKIDYSDKDFCSIQEVNENDAKRLDDLLILSDVDLSCVNVDFVKKSFEELPYKEYKNVHFVLVHGTKLGVSNPSTSVLNFTCAYDIKNPYLCSQAGLFVLNTSDSIPLERQVRNRCFINKIECININKRLKHAIKQEYFKSKSITKELIYPYSEDSENIKTWLKEMEYGSL